MLCFWVDFAKGVKPSLGVRLLAAVLRVVSVTRTPAGDKIPPHGRLHAGRTQLQSPASGDHSSYKMDKLLNYPLHSPLFDLVMYDSFGVDQGNLTDKAQDVVHHGPAGHDQLDGCELSRRQAIKVHVGLVICSHVPCSLYSSMIS